MSEKSCDHCHNDMPMWRTFCPHCGRPRMAPNVDVANTQVERTALENRYQAAIVNANIRGIAVVVSRFEQAVNGAQAVFCCPLDKLNPLVTEHRDLYATFYDLRDMRCRVNAPKPGDPDWDNIRPRGEQALFGDEVKKEIHYAALSLSHTGPSGWGACSIQLRESFIAHRTSAFEKNSLFFFNDQKTRIVENTPVPPGYRSTWAERGKLAVAKLASRLTAGTTNAEFADLLLTSSGNRNDDEFIELHVFGPMTFKTFARITVKQRHNRPGKAKLKALQEYAKLHGVNLVIQ